MERRAAGHRPRVGPSVLPNGHFINPSTPQMSQKFHRNTEGTRRAVSVPLWRFCVLCGVWDIYETGSRNRSGRGAGVLAR